MKLPLYCINVAAATAAISDQCIVKTKSLHETNKVHCLIQAKAVSVCLIFSLVIAKKWEF